jgi:hypothetical protein
LRCAYKFRSSGRLAYWAAKRGDRIGVAEGFVAEYAAAAFPSPCLALQREDQFAAVLGKALALGFTGESARATGI